MRLKAWWRRWRAEHEGELELFVLFLFLLFCLFQIQACGRAEMREDLLKEGYNITKDSAKFSGEGRYTIQVWYDGQWNDVPRCGE